MTTEDRQLLLKDLCARLRYGVKCYPVITNGEPNIIGGYCEILDDFYIREVGGWFNISMIKPYLRPMSSMTEEEKNEIKEITDYSFCATNDGSIVSNSSYAGAVFTSHHDAFKVVDWLNAHHFDYRGLIEKGLALEAPKDMYKNQTNSMKVKDLIKELQSCNQEADVLGVFNYVEYGIQSIAFGGSDGCGKETCDSVDLCFTDDKPET